MIIIALGIVLKLYTEYSKKIKHDKIWITSYEGNNNFSLNHFINQNLF